VLTQRYQSETDLLIFTSVGSHTRQFYDGESGKHRRVRFEHLMRFKSERGRATEFAMEELEKEAQELAMGYP
jgi:hypothetical protein